MIETENETPDWVQALNQLIENRLTDLHTGMPGRIVSYDFSTQKAKVQPELKRKYRGGQTLSLPVIPDVTVLMPRAGKSFLSLPLKKGDQVYLMFAERSTDDWKQSGGEVDPSTLPRKHSFADAFCIPGGYPFSNPGAMDANDVLLVNDRARIVLKPAGKFLLEKIGGDEFLDLVIQTQEKLIAALQTLNTDTTNTIFGPMQLNNFSTYGTLKSDVEKIKAKLQAIKG